MAKPAFSVCLHVGGQHFTSTGKTVVEALDSLNPTQLKSRGKLIVVHKGKRSERMLFPFQLRKLLVSKMFKQIFEKQAIETLR